MFLKKINKKIIKKGSLSAADVKLDLIVYILSFKFDILVTVSTTRISNFENLQETFTALMNV